MAYGLPTHGQPNWDDEVNNSIESVRGDAARAQSTADAAQSSAAQAATDATKAKADAAQALDFTKKPTDDQITSVVTDTTSVARQNLDAAYAAKSTQATVETGRLSDATLSATFARVGRESLYLLDYLTQGATATENRTAFQAAVSAAQDAGKALCVDGCYIDFEGDPVSMTTDDFVLWGTSTATNRLTNTTRGRGVVAATGQRALIQGVWLDGANPTMDLSAQTDADRWQSFGVYFAPSAHHSQVRDIKVSGVMRGVLASTFPVESMTTVTDPLNETLYPALTDITVDGIECENAWTAFQPVSVNGLTIRRVRGSYIAGNLGGADPHLIYASSVGANDGTTRDIGRPNYNVTWGDCHATGGEKAPAFKMRSCRGLTITGGLTAENTPGLLDLILIEDFTVGGGCASTSDTSDAQFSVRFLYCQRGTVDPILVQHLGNATGTVPLFRVDRCEQVAIDRPRISINPTTADANRWVFGVVGICPGLVIERPEIINLGAAAGSAILVIDTSPAAGGSSQAIINDPRVVGTFTDGAKIYLSGSTLRYNPTRLGGTRRIEVMSGVTSGVIGNLQNGVRPDLDPTLLGWHNGEELGSSVQVAQWPSGQKMAYKFGNDWVGNWDGRITFSASGGRRMATATFSTADVDVTVGVKLATGNRAGICLRANGDSDYLTVTRSGGAVKIHKYVAGTPTELATVASSTPNGTTSTLRAVISGSNIIAYLDGVQVLSYTLTGTDATTYTSAVHGLFGDNAGTSVLSRPTVRAAS